jgi:hypothetical protein
MGAVLGEAEPTANGAGHGWLMRRCPWRKKNPGRRDGLRSPTSSWSGLTRGGLHRRLEEEVCPDRLLQPVVRWLTSDGSAVA